MGALQLGLPSPALIPQNWSLMVIDLKNCFCFCFLRFLYNYKIEKIFFYSIVKAWLGEF